MRAKIKEKFHTLAEKLQWTKRDFPKQVDNDHQTSMIMIDTQNTTQYVDETIIKQSVSFIVDTKDSLPLINFDGYNTRDEIQIEHLLDSVIGRSMIHFAASPNMRRCSSFREFQMMQSRGNDTSKQSSNIIMLKESGKSPFRRASNYEILQLQSHRLSKQEKFKLDIQQLEDFTQYLILILEEEQQKRSNLNEALVTLSQPSPFTPSTPVINDVLIYNNLNLVNNNSNQNPSVVYINLLMQKIPFLITEKNILLQQLQLKEQKLNPLTNQTILSSQILLEELKTRKQHNHIQLELSRKQIQEIIQKKNYMILQTSQIQIESWIKNHVDQLEQKYPIMQSSFCSSNLERFIQTLSFFSQNMQRISHSGININQLQLPRAQSSKQQRTDSSSTNSIQNLLLSPQLSSPVIHSPNFRNTLRESMILIDLEQEENDLFERYIKKTEKLQNNYEAQIKTIDEQKILQLQDTFKNQTIQQNQDQILEDRCDLIKSKKMAIADQVILSEKLQIELTILKDKIQWLEGLHPIKR